MSDKEHVGSPETAMCHHRIRAQPCWSLAWLVGAAHAAVHAGGRDTLGRVARAQGGDKTRFQAAQRAACLAKLALLADQEGGLASMRPKVWHQHLVYLAGTRREHMIIATLCCLGLVRAHA